MARFLIGRLLSVIPVLLVVTTIVFLALRLGPGDPAAILAGDSATPEMIAAMRFHAAEAGLVGLAGPVVGVVSGGNVDPERYLEYLQAPIPPEA